MQVNQNEEFYLRYYVGHKGVYGHEFLEFEFRNDGRLRYANNSNYKSDVLIRKECYVSDAILTEIKRIIEESEIVKENDSKWPAPDKIGRQELEIKLGNNHISFTTSKLGSIQDVQNSQDPDGLRVFSTWFKIQNVLSFLQSASILEYYSSLILLDKASQLSIIVYYISYKLILKMIRDCSHLTNQHDQTKSARYFVIILQQFKYPFR